MFRPVTAVKPLLLEESFGVLCNESKQTNKQAKNVGKLSAHQFSSVFWVQTYLEGFWFSFRFRENHTIRDGREVCDDITFSSPLASVASVPLA